MIEKRIGIVAVTAGLLLCMRSALAQTTELVVAVDEAPACKDQASLLKLLSENDKAAFNSALGAAVQSGQCTILRRDQHVVVTGYSPSSKLIQVLQKGLPVEYWTSERSLMRSPAR
jgi:hypothetical protein